MPIYSHSILVSEAPSSGLVVDQARKNGFTIRNRDELSERKATLENNVQPADDIVTPDTPQEKVVRENSWRI